MSKKDADAVRRAWEAINRSEYETGAAFFDPSVVYVDHIVPDSTQEIYRGIEGVAKAWQRWSEPWEEIGTKTEEVIDGGERIVSVHRARARAKASGIAVDLQYSYVWTFRDGKVVHLESYPDRESGLAAAGLSE